MNHFKFIINPYLSTYSITNESLLASVLEKNYELRLIKYNQKKTKHGKSQFMSLFRAINKFETFVKENFNKQFNFYKDLLPKIHEWVNPSSITSMNSEYSNMSDDKQIFLMKAGQSTSLTISSSYARYILANAFFLNIGAISEEFKKLTYGSLDFYMVYENVFQKVSMERCLCQLCYFYQMCEYPDQIERQITFKRHALSSKDRLDWLSVDDKHFDLSRVNIHDNYMEHSNATVFVDFANRFIHIGCIIPSMTQEEVLFSCCPELFVCLLCIEEIDDNEVVTVHNVRRFSTYKGYLSSFAWTGLLKEDSSSGKLIQDVLIIDAVMEDHFTEEAVIRDMNKAYLGFKVFPAGTKISTGKWGCGAFGGNICHKYLQQVCAASVLPNIALDFSNTDLTSLKELKALNDKIAVKKLPINKVVEYLIPSNIRFSCDYNEWVMKRLDETPLK